MPALERDFKLQMRRQNTVEHADLLRAGQVLNLSSQLVDDFAWTRHGALSPFILSREGEMRLLMICAFAFRWSCLQQAATRMAAQ
jgi:hypothetical protein